ncbi:MAG: hypothetical protein AB2588_08375 [Candidatus Thiodiazotropha sp.]
MNDLLGVLIGGFLAIAGSMVATWWADTLSFKRKQRSISALVKAEITAAHDLSIRYANDLTTDKGLRWATPLWKSLPSEIIYLSAEQAVAARKALTLYFELSGSPSLERAKACENACDEALEHFP